LEVENEILFTRLIAGLCGDYRAERNDRRANAAQHYRASRRSQATIAAYDLNCQGEVVL